jgi:hypothetical protein
MGRCSAIKPNGERCGGRAIEGSGWCWNHDPAYAEERRRNASKGGKRAGRGRSSPATAELDRLRARFEDLVGKVLSGDVERGDGAVVGQLLNGARACVAASLKAREVEELEARLEDLERVLEQRGGSRYGA